MLRGVNQCQVDILWVWHSANKMTKLIHPPALIQAGTVSLDMCHFYSQVHILSGFIRISFDLIHISVFVPFLVEYVRSVLVKVVNTLWPSLLGVCWWFLTATGFVSCALNQPQNALRLFQNRFSASLQVLPGFMTIKEKKHFYTLLQTLKRPPPKTKAV